MKMPKDCPFCKGPLCSTFDYLDNQHKTCDKKPNHNVEFVGNYFDPDYCWLMIIVMKPDISVEWNFGLRHVKFTDNSGMAKKVTMLPYFDPDFSSYSKLINKLKKYLLFS